MIEMMKTLGKEDQFPIHLDGESTPLRLQDLPAT
jgi:hypothetical protein